MPLSNLNNEQNLAARAPLGHNLIIASAGTGKTSTIVGRIAHLLNNGISPDRILLLTFTNKAASEMIARLEKFFDKEILNKIHAGTFHAIAYRYLKNNGEIALKQPRELKILLKSVYDAKKFNVDSKIPPYKADFLYDLFSLFLNSAKGESFSDFIAKKYSEHEIYAEIYQEILDEFMDLKKRYNYASFDDLLLLYKEKITADSKVFSEILVDEYQDTNALQNSIILAHKAESLFCVGDYDQSIYAFNGSDISIIASFKDEFKDANIFTLKTNYRSSQEILDIANRVIANNPRIYPKSLEVQNKNVDSKIKVLKFQNTREQYESIAKNIAISGKNRSDIAIIFRNNSSADYMEVALRALKISVRKRGARSFFESREIVAFIDILSLILNPKDMMSALNIFSFGMSAKVAREVYDALIKLGENIKDGFYRPKKINPYQSANIGLFDDILLAQDSARFNEFVSKNFASHAVLAHKKLNQTSAEFLDKCFQVFSLDRKHLSDIFNHVLKSALWSEIARVIASSRAKNSSDLDFALKSIDERVAVLANIAKSYSDLGKFLSAIVLNGAESSSGEGVNLLTIHSSKGLEFDEVFIIDLMDGRFPNIKLMNRTGSLEEERRLFYVATTRAKRNLFLSFALEDSFKNARYAPSIFLKEAGLI